MRINLKPLVKSVITIRALDAAGREISRQTTHNDLTNAAMGVLMTALLRSGPSQITHLYARFGANQGTSPAPLAPVSGDLKKVNRLDFLQSSNAYNGGLWVPVLSAPLQESSDVSLYVGNQATFFFRIPYNISAAQISPSANFSVANSYVYALGLGVAVNSVDRTQDIIISQLQDFAIFQIPSGGQMAIDYTVKFELVD